MLIRIQEIQEHGNLPKFKVNLVSCLSKRLLYLRRYVSDLLPTFSVFYVKILLFWLEVCPGSGSALKPVRIHNTAKIYPDPQHCTLPLIHWQNIWPLDSDLRYITNTTQYLTQYRRYMNVYICIIHVLYCTPMVFYVLQILKKKFYNETEINWLKNW
jgi:hypothetical protein